MSIFQRLGATALISLCLGTSVATAEQAICYNCPTEWADWGTQLQAIKKATKVAIPADNKNSGQSLAQLIAEKEKPVADITYLGVSFAVQAQKEGVLAPYQPALWEEIPDGLKDPQGHWFSIHSGTMGFMVNVDALDGKEIPRSWADLLKPEYKGLIGYLDPTSAFVGYVAAVAANEALGGSLDNFAPAYEFFNNLQANEPIVPKQTSYARVLSGEIAILLDYDFNAYRAKYKDAAPIEFVIPAEGTIVVPYVISKVANAPHGEAAEKALDFVLSDEGQAIWANAYLRPVRASAMPESIKTQFLADSEYERATTVDYLKMAEVQRAFSDQYLKVIK